MENKLIKLALIGNKGVGKSFVADTLEERFTFVQQFAFADPLKTLVEFMFNWIPAEYTLPENKEKPIAHELNVNNLSYREILVEVGAIANRIEPGIFIRKCNENVNWFSLENPEVKAIITDVRTKEEVDFCKKNGIPIVKVISDSTPHTSDQGAVFESYVQQFNGQDDTLLNIKGVTTKDDIEHFFKKYLID